MACSGLAPLPETIDPAAALAQDPGELNTTSPAADCRRDINSGPTQSRLDPYRQGDRQRCQGEQSSPGEKRRGGANLLEQHASTHRADDGCQGGARLRTTICQPLLVA